MPRIVTPLALLCALNLTLFVVPAAGAAAPAAAAPAGVTSVIVQLRGSALAADPHLKARTWQTRYHFRFDPTLPAARSYGQALSSYQDAEIAYLKHHVPGLHVKQRFHVLFNGLTVTLPTKEVPALQSLQNVVRLSGVPRYRPLLDRSLPLINVPEAWSQLGGGPDAGKGLMIADIDSGIDIQNPCFNDSGFKPPAQFGGHPRADTQQDLALTNNKVIVARVFAGDNPNGSVTAADDIGHGTFTGAIEACDYNTLTPLGTHVSGVAPAAYLMSYKVFFGQQPVTAADYDPFLAAMEAALLDGADVINFSGGVALGAGESPFDSDEQAVETATRAGVTVVVSAGNAGPTSESVSSPAADASAIAVGAVTNERSITSSLRVQGPGDVPAALSRIAGREGSYAWSGTIGSAQLVDVGEGRMPGQDPGAPKANDFAGKDVQGKIAVMEHGIIRSTTKLLNAKNAGAIGAVFWDEVDEVGLGTIGQSFGCPDTPPDNTCYINFPVLFISNRDGKSLVSWLHNNPDTSGAMDSTLYSSDETPAVVTDWSSRGDGPGYSIKPDLVGPGQDIYSATENDDSRAEMYDPTGFLSADGTSFSSPHVAGVATLVLSKHPKWTPAMIKAVLMNTASTDVWLDRDRTQTPSVMDAGSGLVDAESAMNATAYLSPPSTTFGSINVGSGAQQRTGQLTLNDLGGGAGTWQVSLKQLHGADGFAFNLPASVTLPANGRVNVSLQLNVATSTPAGAYDGYIILTKGTESLHVPYYARVTNVAIKAGSILLVDNTISKFQPPAPQPALPHKDVSGWYERTLTALHKTYTYWDESKLGTPSLADMKQAAAVIAFTGTNLNAWDPTNVNSEALMPPFGPDDLTNFHAYLDGGGKLFLTGMGAALPDGNIGIWTGLVLGANPTELSVFDNPNGNDKFLDGNKALPKPSVYVDTGKGPKHAGPFVGLKPIDLSPGGDGADDNRAVHNPFTEALDKSLGLIGVAGMQPLTGTFDTYRAFGRSALSSSVQSVTNGGLDVGIVNSDEPTFKRAATYPGRSVLFSFGFEGINSNTGYATREQVLGRILQWFDDHPTAKVVAIHPSHGQRVQLRASLGGGQKAAQYVWQVGSQTLKGTETPTTYTFPHAGTYKIRVLITDALGHSAVSPSAKVTVR